MNRFITMATLVGIMSDHTLATPTVRISKTTTVRVPTMGVRSSQPAGVVIPDHGDWSAFVQIKGKDFLSVTRVRASRYLNYEKG